MPFVCAGCCVAQSLLSNASFWSHVIGIRQHSLSTWIAIAPITWFLAIGMHYTVLSAHCDSWAPSQIANWHPL